VEDHVLEAGFGSAVLELLADEGLMGVKVKRLRMRDRSMNRAAREELSPWSEIEEESIVQAALQLMQEGKRRRRQPNGLPVNRERRLSHHD
jgi:1-deoxy-D-xylulose-5-phosphate synthase